jgi:hypothetical protein
MRSIAAVARDAGVSLPVRKSEIESTAERAKTIGEG